MKYNKGFAPVIILIIVLGVLAVGGVVYFVGKSSAPKNEVSDNSNQYPPVTQNQNPSTTSNNYVPPTTNNNPPVNNPTTSNENNTTTDQDRNGKHIGYIKSVSDVNGNYSLKIDYIQWIIPCVANAQTSYCMNGYEVVNSNPLIRTFSISNNAVIKMQTWSHDVNGNFNSNEIVSLSQFKGVINSTLIPPSYTNMTQYNPSPYTGRYNTGTTTVRGIPFWITLNNGIITEITEQYIP